jgi:hypothetical protein
MSNTQTPAAPGKKELKSEENPLIPKLKDAGLLLGWIAGLILIAGFCWFFTQSLRNRFLLRAVNRVLEQSGDSRRLGEALSPKALKAGFSGIGVWYTIRADALMGRSSSGNISDGTMALIFAFMGEGYFFPCAAIMTENGKVQEFIPLNSYGERVIKRISPGILAIYTRRIEGT